MGTDCDAHSFKDQGYCSSGSYHRMIDGVDFSEF